MIRPVLTLTFLALALGACATPPPTTPELLGEALVDAGTGEEPLLDLLDAGFSAAVLRVRREGDRLASGPGGERDFESQDLRPLVRELVAAERESFLLLLVIREDPDETYDLLAPLLHSVRKFLTRYEAGQLLTAPLRVVLTGSVPVERMVRERTRYAFVAGGRRELDSSPYSADLLPLVRLAYDELLGWDESGPLPEEQRMALQAVTARAHAQGRLVSVRGAPQSAWEALLVGGVDYIEIDAVGTREADRFAHFLARRVRR